MPTPVTDTPNARPRVEIPQSDRTIARRREEPRRPATPGDTYQPGQGAVPRAPEQRTGRTNELGELSAQRALINAGARLPRPSNDNVTFVGMNPTGRDEAAEFARRTGTQTTFIGPSARQAQVEHEGRTYDLRDRAGIDAFTRTFGLPEEQRARVANAIESTGEGARDEIAKLAQHWATAERGGTIPSRLVISGHSVGAGVWGDQNGTLTQGSLRNLAQAMPRAASQIEDVHIAGCYSGGRNGLDSWRQMFPNAKTVWAYSGSAPGAASGAQAHLARWANATRGRADDLDPSVARNTRKGENVETWSERGGYRTQAAAAFAEMQRRYEAGRPEAARFMSGEREVTDPQSGPLRDHYNNLQALLRSSELPAAQRPGLEAERDRTIRALYFTKTVAPSFAREHGSAIAGAYRALGSEPPDFARLSRRDALAEIAAYERRAGTNAAPSVRRALELLRGLRDLDPRAIPDAWVG